MSHQEYPRVRLTMKNVDIEGRESQLSSRK
jgi:hypothetical protein